MKSLPKLSLNMPHLGATNGTESKPDKSAESVTDKSAGKRKPANQLLGDNKRPRLDGKPTVRLAKAQGNAAPKSSAIRANRGGTPESGGGGGLPAGLDARFQRLKNSMAQPDLKTATDAVKTGLSVGTLMREKVLRDTMPGAASVLQRHASAPAATALDTKVAQLMAEVKANMDKRSASLSFNHVSMGMYGSAESRQSVLGVLKQKATHFADKLQSVDVQAVASRLHTRLGSIQRQGSASAVASQQQLVQMSKAVVSSARSALEPLKTSVQRMGAADVKAVGARLGNKLLQHYQHSSVARLAGQLGEKMSRFAKDQKPRVMSGLQTVSQSVQSFAGKLSRLLDEPPSSAGQWREDQHDEFLRHVGGGHDAEHYHGFNSQWHDRG